MDTEISKNEVKQKIVILTFLHESPNEIPGGIHIGYVKIKMAGTYK